MDSASSNSIKNKIDELKKEFAAATDYYVLHVDDEPNLLEVYRDRLAEFGIQTLSALSGAEALEILKEKSNQIVLIASDIKMPNMEGFELRKQVLALYPQIPFGIISAFVDRDIALRGLELKIAAFLAKPVDFDSYAELLHKEALPKLRHLKEENEIKRSFIYDTENLLEESEEVLLQLEKGTVNQESLNRYYAIIHTIKGSAAFFDPKDLHKFSHGYEDILKKLQNENTRLSPSAVAVLFKGFDTIKMLFQEFKASTHQPHDIAALIANLNLQITSSQKETNPSTAEARHGNQAQPQGAPPQLMKAYGTEDIRVSVKLLDEFMHLSGEVTVIRNMLNKCVASIERRFAGDRDVGMLTELLSELHKINSAVQNKMTDIRKVPLKSVLRGLPRAVRDVTHSLGKIAELEIEGDDLRVDTSIAEVLSNSLLHIIKNSLDHGIEKPQDRMAVGKPEAGWIQVSACTRDDKVVVRISDDGRGLNVEAIKSRLLKNGKLTHAEITAMSQTEIYGMIFSPGFSTAEQVTEISGRGVGMSMVKDSVEAVGGRIVIESTPGQGACFQLELPIPKSVLIASCLGVRIGARRFSLAQDDVIRVLQFHSEQAPKHIQNLEGSECLIFEGNLIPLVDFNRLFRLGEPVKNSEVRKLVVMNSGRDNRKMALEVSEILDTEDMVIKSIHPTLNSSMVFRGLTFLDDGRVGLIINTGGVMDALHLAKDIPQTKKALTNTNLQEAQSQLTLQRRALTVRVANSGLYAISQEAIFRIEEVATKNIRQSGRQQVIPYRGGVLRIEKLSRLLRARSHPESISAPRTTVQLIVVRQSEDYLGLEVDEILDMVEMGDVKTELAQQGNAIEGHFFIGDKTVALIDLNALYTKLSQLTDLEEAAAESLPMEAEQDQAA